MILRLRGQIKENNSSITAIICQVELWLGSYRWSLEQLLSIFFIQCRFQTVRQFFGLSKFNAIWHIVKMTNQIVVNISCIGVKSRVYNI